MKPGIKILLLMSLSALLVGGCQPRGDMLFEDDFSDPESGWEVFDNQSIQSQYKEGAYQIKISPSQKEHWTLAPGSFGDVDVEVNAYHSAGSDDNKYGIICKYVDVNRFYALVISSDGSYMVEKRTKQGYERLSGMFYQLSPEINTGSATNKIRAVCGDGFLELYVNGELINRVEDDTYSEGQVGLIAGNFTAMNLQIDFDDYTVRQIP